MYMYLGNVYIGGTRTFRFYSTLRVYISKFTTCLPGSSGYSSPVLAVLSLCSSLLYGNSSVCLYGCFGVTIYGLDQQKPPNSNQITNRAPIVASNVVKLAQREDLFGASPAIHNMNVDPTSICTSTYIAGAYNTLHELRITFRVYTYVCCTNSKNKQILGQESYI